MFVCVRLCKQNQLESSASRLSDISTFHDSQLSPQALPQVLTLLFGYAADSTFRAENPNFDARWQTSHKSIMNYSQICCNSVDLIAGTRTSQEKCQLQLWRKITFPSSLWDTIVTAVWMDMLRDVKRKPFMERLLLTSQSQSQNRQWLPCRLSDDLNCWCWHSICTSRQCYCTSSKN